MKTLVLGLGNDILADDAVGILAARALKERLGDVADVQETSWHGVALLELFIGYERAILIDAVMTGKHAPGTLIEINPDELAPIQGASPHFTGLPEMIAMAKELELTEDQIRASADSIRFPADLPMPKNFSDMVQKTFLSVPGLLTYSKPLPDEQVMDRSFLQAVGAGTQ